MDPELACKRIKPQDVARGRALVAWLWTERMGRPQVAVADGLNLRPTTVSKMLNKLRRGGLEKREERILKRVFKKLIDSGTFASSSSPKEVGIPKVAILKRKR